MVIPLAGFPLARLLDQVDRMRARATSPFRPCSTRSACPNHARGVLGLALRRGPAARRGHAHAHILATGLYGQPLPSQNGTPVRLVVPWKYGFKSIKSVVRITLTRDVPPTSWNLAAPDEYGFYSNVNPEVPHPRWSQSSERRIGEFGRRPTLLFNGYADEVAHLYAGMDLRKSF